jgi:hypothetical protein
MVHTVFCAKDTRLFHEQSLAQPQPYKCTSTQIQKLDTGFILQQWSRTQIHSRGALDEQMFRGP